MTTSHELHAFAEELRATAHEYELSMEAAKERSDVELASQWALAAIIFRRFAEAADRIEGERAA